MQIGNQVGILQSYTMKADGDLCTVCDTIRLVIISNCYINDPRFQTHTTYVQVTSLTLHTVHTLYFSTNIQANKQYRLLGFYFNKYRTQRNELKRTTIYIVDVHPLCTITHVHMYIYVHVYICTCIYAYVYNVHCVHRKTTTIFVIFRDILHISLFIDLSSMSTFLFPFLQIYMYKYNSITPIISTL